MGNINQSRNDKHKLCYNSTYEPHWYDGELK